MIFYLRCSYQSGFLSFNKISNIYDPYLFLCCFMQRLKCVNTCIIIINLVQCKYFKTFIIYLQILFFVNGEDENDVYYINGNERKPCIKVVLCTVYKIYRYFNFQLCIYHLSYVVHYVILCSTIYHVGMC